MICPACAKPLSEMTVSDLKVDVCQSGCHGIWFDNYELEKVDEAHESLGEKLLEFLPSSGTVAHPSAKRKCPKCPDIVMQRFFFSTRKEVEIDDCPNCGGTWLDANELANIRAGFKTEEDRKKAGQQIFSQIFDKELAVLAAQSKAEVDRSQKFARSLKYILPSYWIPGKQEGGAF